MQGSNPKHAMYPMGTGVMYHVSPRKNREQIMSEGLQGQERHNLTDSPWDYRVDQPPGNYLFDNPDDAKGYAYTLRGQKAKADDWTKEPDWEDQFTHTYPDNFDDLSDDEKDTWYDENEPVERKDDHNGYDIYAVNAHGLPLAPDPESRLHHGPEDLGSLYEHYQKARKDMDWTEQEPHPEELHNEVGQYYGNEPKRYYVPAGITPDRLQLHEHMPSWDMTMGGYHDYYEDEDRQSVPSAWMQTPMTEWPQPGHDPRLGKLTRQSMPAVLYHSAPAAARQQIMQQGILPKQELQPHQPFYYPGDEHVWTFNDPDTAAWWAKGDRGGNNDVWRIDAQALPQSAIDYGAAKDHGTFLHGRVPPGAIELHYPAENLPSTQPAWATTSTWEFSPLSYTGEENSTELDTKQSAYDPARDPDDAMHDELYSGWSSAHDYDPRWDYSDELRPHWQTHPLAQQAQQMLNGLGEHGRVYAADLSQYGAVGMYIQGTQGEPVILFDPKAHEGYEDQVGQTISHEVRHAQQEREGVSFDEDDAEEGHRNTKTAAAMHPKHHTTLADHERGKQRYGLPKPHKKRKIVLFPKRRKGAVDPQWLQQWIETNGPWLYHSCNSDVRDKILKEGLVPHDRGPGSKYEQALVPRDNSVYIRAIPYNRHMADNSAMHSRRVAIDLRKLDPSRIQADEDAWFEPVDHRKIGIPRTTEQRGPMGGPLIILKDTEGNQFPHWGAWADHWQLNQPGQTAHSLNGIKTASVYGGIDPSALKASEDVPFDEQPGYDLETPMIKPVPIEPEHVMAAPPYPTRKLPCQHCQGKGEVTEQYDQWEEPWQRPCPECQGDGYLINALTASAADDFMERLDRIPGVRHVTPIPNLAHSYGPGDRVTFEYNSLIDPDPEIPEQFHGINANSGTIHSQADDGRYIVRWDLGADWGKRQPYYAPGELSTPVEGQSLWPEGHEALEHGLTKPQDPKSLDLLYPPKSAASVDGPGAGSLELGQPKCQNCGSTDLSPRDYPQPLYQCRDCAAYTMIPNEGLQVERQKIPVYSLPELGPVRQGAASDLQPNRPDLQTTRPSFHAPNTHSLTPCSSAQHPIERLLGLDAYLSPVSFSPLPHQADGDKVDTRSLARIDRQASGDNEGRETGLPLESWPRYEQGNEKPPHSTSHSSYEDSDTPWLEHSDQHAGSSSASSGVEVGNGSWDIGMLGQKASMSEDLKGIPYAEMFDRGTLNRTQSISDGTRNTAQSFSMGPLWMEHAAGTPEDSPYELDPKTAGKLHQAAAPAALSALYVLKLGP